LAINTEIERRFLVDGRGDKPWRECHSKINIKQFYLDSAAVEFNQQSITYSGFELVKITPEEHRILVGENNWTSRIRMADEDIILTMKGKRLHASATELEWKINSLPSMQNLELLPHVIKTRYNKLGNDGLLWEIDEFEGLLAGLILAEVELESQDQVVEIPSWIGMELTGLGNWSNAALASTLANANSLKK
jgi:adenylate cyclase